MGHQLWTSPITGYRRRGTRLSELRSLIEAGITAHAILEPLQCCPAEMPAAEAAQMLRKRDFDVAGVKLTDGPVSTWVALEDLKDGSVQNHMQEITVSELISDATPLPAMLTALKSRQFTFVLIGSDETGIVTRADLNKPPVRIYLFSLISLLEMHLGFWLRAGYPDDSWQGTLDPERLAAAQNVQKERRKRNQDPILAECLQFCDKRDLVVVREDLRTKLSLGTKRESCRSLRRAEELRNQLAHSQQDLAQGSEWEKLIALVEWIEAVVHCSDELVEQEAASHAGSNEDGLWASA